MLQSLAEVLSNFKSNWTRVLDPQEIERVCRKNGLLWRERILSPVQTIQLFVLQILHGNTALSHVRFFTPRGFSASAYCQARSRLPLAVFEELLNKMGARSNQGVETWHGRRVYLTDGSNFSMSDTPELRNRFGQPAGQKEGCGFPVAHFIALFHVSTGMIRQVLSGPLFSHDLARFVKLHGALKRRDVVVGDRAFCSFAHVALLVRRGVDAVFRCHQAQIVNFRAGRAYSSRKGMPRSRWEKKLGIRDQLVTWFKPSSVPLWMSANQYRLLPATLLLRELAYDVPKRGFRTRHVVLLSTLLDPSEFPKEVLADLYRQRWSIETSFNHLKTTMGMNVLNCRTADGVLKEFYMFCIVYNLVRTVMLKAGAAQGLPPNRISFVDALRWLLCACSRHTYQRLAIVPVRPNRSEPRAVKRRPKEYDLLTKPRKLYRTRVLHA
jgi:hypothetical protein